MRVALREPILLLFDSVRFRRRGTDPDEPVSPFAEGHGLCAIGMELVVYSRFADRGFYRRSIWLLYRLGRRVFGLGIIYSRSAALEIGRRCIFDAYRFWFWTNHIH